MRTPRFTLALAVAVALAACDQPTPTSPVDVAPAFAKGGRFAACPAADYVVTDQASLDAALGSAQPGDVIGVDGTIALSHPTVVETGGLTFTCAAPGSGLEAAPYEFVFEVYAENVTIADLRLNGETGAGAVYGFSDDVDFDGDGLHFEQNIVRCGTHSCLFLPSVRDVVVADNHFTAAVPGGTGVHIQTDATGAHVTGNTLVAEVPTGNGVFGAIRVRDGTGIVIRDNVIEGPWSNGLAVADLFDADIDGNAVTGTALDGFRIINGPLAGGGTVGPYAVGANLFHNNRVADAGGAAFAVLTACGDVFRANHVGDNALGVYFGEATGNNIWQGGGASVSDQGSFDCDGDGSVDPNAVTGPGLRTSNVKLGRVIQALDQASGTQVMR